MPRVSTYLNFPRQTEEAFLFYKTVFGGEFTSEIKRLGSAPRPEGAPALAEADKNLVMFVELPIVGGHLLRGTDAPESMGFQVTFGNNVYINLEVDTRAEVDRLFGKLSQDAKAVEMAPQEMFWGDYLGMCTDKFGVQWMLTASAKA